MEQLTLARLRRHEADPPQPWPQRASKAYTVCVAVMAYLVAVTLVVALVTHFAPASSVAEPCGGPGVCVWGP